ncbi:MAG TPA: glycosyltransferase, partial [Gaiellaceae bacterium]|nr:glycosyltransferase [Gaiellaceae bacterium]
ERLARERGLNGRAEFTGRIDEAELASLYARCLAVYYAPVDEDFGMVPYEAFLSGKPVLTTTDAGGPLEIVTDGRTGRVTAPEPGALAAAAGFLSANPAEAESYGRAGRELAAKVTWDGCIDRLLA